MINKISKNKKLIIYIAVGLVFAVGMAIATKYDYRISTALTRFTSDPITMTVPTIGIVLEIIGEWPSLIIGSFCGAVIMRNILLSAPRASRVYAALFTLVIVALMYYGVDATAEHIFGELGKTPYLLYIIISVALACAIIAFVMRLPKTVTIRFLVPAIICGALLAALFLGIQGIKSVFGRIRFREMVAMGDMTLFTPWYSPNLFSGHHSFPSGHTANAVSLGLIPIFYYEGNDERSRKLKLLTYVFVGVWSAAMAFSRICVGAHFLSDVLVGAALAFIAVEFGNYAWRRVRLFKD